MVTVIMLSPGQTLADFGIPDRWPTNKWPVIGERGESYPYSPNAAFAGSVTLAELETLRAAGVKMGVCAAELAKSREWARIPCRRLRF